MKNYNVDWNKWMKDHQIYIPQTEEELQKAQISYDRKRNHDVTTREKHDH